MRFPTVKQYYRVARHDMAYLKFILEGYEGMTTLSTVAPREGIVVLTIPLPFQDDISRLIESLQMEITLEEIHPPSGCQ